MFSSKECVFEPETRQKPKSADTISQQNQSHLYDLRAIWSTFRAMLDTKVRILTYRIAPFFTVQEYYLSPWYEKSRRKAEEASHTRAWQHMNQRIHVHVERPTVLRSNARNDSGGRVDSEIDDSKDDNIAGAIAVRARREGGNTQNHSLSKPIEIPGGNNLSNKKDLSIDVASKTTSKVVSQQGSPRYVISSHT